MTGFNQAVERIRTVLARAKQQPDFLVSQQAVR